MTSSNRFRCPFEKQGINNGTLIGVQLSEDRNERFAAIASGFAAFHAKPESEGLRLILPDSLQKSCSSLTELERAIGPYQAELLAAEMEFRFKPLLPYQQGDAKREVAKEYFIKNDHLTIYCVAELLTAMGFCGFPPPGRVEDIAGWISIIWAQQQLSFPKKQDTAIVVSGDVPIDDKGTFEKAVLFVARPGSLTIPGEREHDRDRNCFNIVKTPFYPRAFGRFSTQIEFVVSRERDIKKLSHETRRRIRYQSNKVLRQAGVVIVDLFEDKQPTGLWKPEYVRN